ncbi:PLP-dependent aminotransferase family protein [Dactylosporangium roseum]|uniref:PLP-dependent aminotransferase family protein n=1 Tax=Dactylosporangium roseum TaxID=47989 RepID=A0ABY5YYJ7_9ACTN|nr:PLP-dependent aminotransferase family protein [Dactylosporangium roseum]UWZ33648.1 PLP-dependent aminotransferase family protein [Dactylosporangium roseum]
MAAAAGPTIQYVARAGILDLGWGHPHPAALPVDEWGEATGAALREHGWRGLTYGYAAGPGELVDWLCAHLAGTDGRGPRPAEVFVTAGASHALELVSSLLVSPGDTVLVDTPTYHLALRVLTDRRADLVGVPFADPAAVAEAAARLRGAGRTVRLGYVVPTFGNPTGASLPADRRRELLAVAAAYDLLVIEDDTYRELSYAGPAPASLWSADHGGRVVRIGSFAKTVAPGLRLGWLTGPPELIGALTDRGYVDSGGGVNHTVALTMATFGASGGYARHVARGRGRYNSQRDALVAALRAEGLDPPLPDGGWFVWLPLPDGLTASALLPRAEAAGVSFMCGRRFHAGGGPDDHVRLSYSMLGPGELAEAARRLATALRGFSPRPAAR